MILVVHDCIGGEDLRLNAAGTRIFVAVSFNQLIDLVITLISDASC